MRINLFSPLPPVLSEISNYTVQVATALHVMADVTLWTAQPEAPEVPGCLSVRQFDPARLPWESLQAADLTLYCLGNNARFHRDIFDVARQLPGVIVVHDTRLQHFFAGYSETTDADRAYYRDIMRRYHGAEALVDADSFLAGTLGIDALVSRYPLTMAAVDAALAVVLHNPVEARVIAQGTRTPVFVLPLPFATTPLAAPPARGADIRLIVFGFIGLNRRLDRVLEAMAGAPDQAVRLDVYGTVEEEVQLDALIESFGLSERVHRHGYVPAAELDAALAAADLALNLRYPTMGEASASQLRIWNAGVPSLVTRTGWYAELPADAVLSADPDDEVATIRHILANLRRDPARFRRIGQAGRAALAQHDPDHYAATLLRAVQQVDTLHARRSALDLTHTAAFQLLEAAGVPGVTLATAEVSAAIAALTAEKPPTP